MRILIATAALAMLAGCTANDILLVEQNAVPCARAVQTAVAGASDNVAKGLAAGQVVATNPDCLALSAAAAKDIASVIAKGGTVQTAAVASIAKP